MSFLVFLFPVCFLLSHPAICKVSWLCALTLQIKPFLQLLGDTHSPCCTSALDVVLSSSISPRWCSSFPEQDITSMLYAGQTFTKPAKLIITEKPTAYGKYWTWVHWEIDVMTSTFLKCSDILCRAWDWSQNTQPAQLTWTLLGQGNNSMFCLKCHKEVDEQVRLHSLLFA